MKQGFSYFITYEVPAGNYSIEDFVKTVYKKGDHEPTLQTEFDHISMKTTLNLTRFGLTYGELKFDEKFFFKTSLGYTAYRHYKPTKANDAESPGVYTGEKIINLGTIDENHLKCDIIVGSVVNGIRQPLLYCFVLSKPPK